MNEEFNDLIASFRLAEDLEQVVESTIRARLGELSATPMTALPLEEAEALVDQPSSLRVKRVESRVIERLRAA